MSDPTGGPAGLVLAAVLVVLAGVIAFKFLPLSALPEVDYPTIHVQTSFPGASPEVMSTTVTAPLERQFGQMADLNRILDYSTYGGAPLLGIRGVSIVCHGASSPNAIKNAIRVAIQAASAGLSQHIGAEFAQRQTAAPA